MKKLKTFEKLFVSSEESLIFSNQGSIPELELHKIDFKKIQTLEESIPEPQEIILNGIVEELKYSKLKVTINTKEGPVSGILSDNLNPSEVSQYWGKELTIAGTAHYQPSGKMSFLYIERIFEPDEADKYFSKSPKRETVEQQIQRQQKQLRHSNHLNELIGQWPGNEDIDEILNFLD